MFVQIVKEINPKNGVHLRGEEGRGRLGFCLEKNMVEWKKIRGIIDITHS
jgi:hypothetical protein